MLIHDKKNRGSEDVSEKKKKMYLNQKKKYYASCYSQHKCMCKMYYAKKNVESKVTSIMLQSHVTVLDLNGY